LLGAVVTAGALVTGTLGPGAAQGTTFINWSQYLFSTRHTSENPAATVITPANAGSLKLLWKFTPAAAPISGLGGFYSSPTVFNGVIYIGARNGYFYAINESTGTVVWNRFIGYVSPTTCGPEGFTSTATVKGDPTTGKLLQHRKPIRGARKDAQAYADWITGMVAAGETVTATVSQTELRILQALQAKADGFRDKLVTAVHAGAKVEPGPLQLSST